MLSEPEAYGPEATKYTKKHEVIVFLLDFFVLRDHRGKAIIKKCLHATLKHNACPDFLRSYENRSCQLEMNNEKQLTSEHINKKS
jgi:hypothetical protein